VELIKCRTATTFTGGGKWSQSCSGDRVARRSEERIADVTTFLH